MRRGKGEHRASWQANAIDTEYLQVCRNRSIPIATSLGAHRTISISIDWHISRQCEFESISSPSSSSFSSSSSYRNHALYFIQMDKMPVFRQACVPVFL